MEEKPKKERVQKELSDAQLEAKRLREEIRSQEQAVSMND